MTSSSEFAIVARAAGVKYDLRLSRRRTLRQAVGARLAPRSERSGRRGGHEFWALRDVTFALRHGEVLGVVGRNGSGKSTLLLTLAGVLRPDAGVVTTSGRASTLLTLGAGFELDLTGRDNIYLNAAYLGFPQRKMAARLDDIIAFSELGPFIDAPLSTYSTGMRSRLGFSIAAHTEPDILLLDEVLGVGDAAFQRKSREKIDELMGQAQAIVIVAHNADLLASVATKVLWLDGGQLAAFGEPEETLERYLEADSRAQGPVRTVAAAGNVGAASNE